MRSNLLPEMYFLFLLSQKKGIFFTKVENKISKFLFRYKFVTS
jgi:hypothetical protein